MGATAEGRDLRELAAAVAAAAGAFDEGRARLLYGESLRRVGRRKHARDELRRSAELFDGLGAVSWAERARREIAATAPTNESRGGDGLTPQEAEVARLVAAGATNREVAQQLFVTPKTVEFHLGNVFRKVGVRSRSELAARFARPAAREEASPLVGRDRDLADVQAALARHRLVTITGPGGSGKTALARAVADDDAAFVDLTPLRDASLAAWQIASTLRVPGESESAVDAIAHALRERPRLVLLDNFEHLLDAAVVVSNLLDAAPQVRILVTSRVPLHVPEEHEYRLGALAPAAAESLFINRAREVLPAFAADPGVVATICERVDRLPLPIEFTAARVDVLSPTELRDKLSARLHVLTRRRHGVADRHQTLRAALDWSYDLLAEDDRRALARLAIFEAPFGVDAADAVAGVDLETTDRLRDANLVAAAFGTPRMRLLDTIREYALEQLGASGERVGVVQAHGEYFARVVEGAWAALDERRIDEWLARVEPVYPDVRATFARSKRRRRRSRTVTLRACCCSGSRAEASATGAHSWSVQSRCRLRVSPAARERVLRRVAAREPVRRCCTRVRVRARRGRGDRGRAGRPFEAARMDHARRRVRLRGRPRRRDRDVHGGAPARPRCRRHVHGRLVARVARVARGVARAPR